MIVASTLEDLAAERVAAHRAIEELRFIPVLFELGARAHPPRALYRAYLEQSQVVVGIYWSDTDGSLRGWRGGTSLDAAAVVAISRDVLEQDGVVG